MTPSRPIQILCLLTALTGCDAKKIDQFGQRVVAIADKHESLHDQMLDCEERYCQQLATLSDMEAVKQAKPQMNAEIIKYRELSERFLSTKGLTLDKWRGILKRSLTRQIEINQKMKEHQDRLLATGRPGDGILTFDSPPISWFSVKFDFDRDVIEVAQGRPRHETLDEQMERMKAERAAGPSGRERAQQAAEEAKARIEEGKARMEAMRAKMGPRSGPGVRPGPRPVD